MYEKLTTLDFVTGIVLAAVVVLPWVIIITLRKPMAQMLRETTIRFKEDPGIKQSALVALAHGVLLLGISLLLIFVVTLFKEMFESTGGSLPWYFMALIKSSEFVQHGLVWLVPVSLTLLWFDAKIYRSLFAKKSIKATQAWARGISAVLFLILLWYIGLVVFSFIWITQSSQIFVS